MDNNKETKERLIESAHAEFSENGYTKASLRKICANAGVTTGALYFFFKDKEDLFAAVVEQPFTELKELVAQHFFEHEQIMSAGTFYEHINDDHDELSAALIHHIYAHHDAFMLLLTKSQGSRFEGCVDEIVEMTEKAYRIMASNMADKMPGKRVNTYMLHWFTHMNVDAFIHLITHEPDEHKALENMSRIMNFLVRGWLEMILDPKDDK